MIAGLGVLGGAIIGLIGGWMLRGDWDEYKAEVTRDCKWDQRHGIPGDD